MALLSLEGGRHFFPALHSRSEPHILSESPNGVDRVQKVVLNSLRAGSTISMFYNENSIPKKESNKSIVLTVLEAQEGEERPAVIFRCQSVYGSVKDAFWGADGSPVVLHDGSEVVIQSGFSSPSDMVRDGQLLQRPSYGHMISGESYWFGLPEKGFVVARNVRALYLRDGTR